MQFAYPLPWWTWILIVAAVAFVASRVYTRTPVTLSSSQRAILMTLRFVTLILIVMFLARPVRLMPSGAAQRHVVPILIDNSRSMALSDDGGRRRIDRAQQVLDDLVPRLTGRFRPEVLTFGEDLIPGGTLGADGRRSDLTGALEAAALRYRGESPAGMIVISDGGDTGGRDTADAIEEGGPKIFTIGVGEPAGQRDREVLTVTAGDASVADSMVDLTVSAVSRGYGTTPFEIRVLANGRLADARKLTPPADGSPISEIFPVAPDPASPTLYTIEIPADPGEIAKENNIRSVLVRPPGRRRRILLLEGAPGFEHSFLKRAWNRDPGIEVDSVVRKGENDKGSETFYIQAAAARTGGLVSGFPDDRAGLFHYDAIVLANVESDSLTREQLAMLSAFVAERGGGLLVLGSRSFANGGFVNTALEEVLPLELSARGSGPVPASDGPGIGDEEEGVARLVPTRDGERHPVIRLGRTVDDTRRRWAAMPTLATTTVLGGPRPGATVLALSGTARGAAPLLAVQRYGQGRTMIFTGEATWRWKMMMAATDRTYETFWRQTARWLTNASPDPVGLREVADISPGDTLDLAVMVRDPAFLPVADATVVMRVTLPGGEAQDIPSTLVDAASGTYRASVRADQRGVYGVTVRAQRGAAELGGVQQWVLVGGADREMADPRLNDEVLRRIASATGGRYVPARDAATLVPLLETLQDATAVPERRDLWNNAWTFLTMIALLAGEWGLRRRWGMR